MNFVELFTFLLPLNLLVFKWNIKELKFYIKIQHEMATIVCKIRWGFIKHKRTTHVKYYMRMYRTYNMSFVWRVSDKRQVLYCMWLKFFAKLIFFAAFFVMKFEWVQEEGKRKEMWWQVFVCVGWITKTFSTSSSSLSQFEVVVSQLWKKKVFLFVFKELHKIKLPIERDEIYNLR